jgi:hypothetical protein
LVGLQEKPPFPEKSWIISRQARTLQHEFVVTAIDIEILDQADWILCEKSHRFHTALQSLLRLV